MKVIQHFCKACNQFKKLFDIDIYDTKSCLECGNVLIPREVEL